MKKNVLAIDLGASTGRAILGRVEDSILDLKEIHRFKNLPIEEDTIFWDFEALLSEVKKSLKLANKKCDISSVGIDTWGVDFGLIDKNGKIIDWPVHYRDNRTQGMIREVTKSLSMKELYEQTGNQIMNINTVFQIMYLKKETSILDETEKILLMPDLFNYFLTGIKSTEATIASTTQLFSPYDRNWNYKLMDQLKIKRNMFTEIVNPGTQIGRISKSISNELDIPEIPVTSVCAHDTASAVVSIPTEEKDFLFISSGTWSLIGTELDSPMINEQTYKYNITNESGIDGTTRLLKNITGLWLIQETKRQWEKEGKFYSFTELEKLAKNAQPFKCFIDPEYYKFQDPGNMPLRIRQFAKMTGQEEPKSDGEVIRCIYESLAFKYNYIFKVISEICVKDYKTVNIVGGGIQAQLLSQMIANISGMDVLAGPIEATAIGNIMVQLISIGEVEDTLEARNIIKNSFKIKKYKPQDHENWVKQFKKYKEILNSQGGVKYE